MKPSVPLIASLLAVGLAGVARPFGSNGEGSGNTLQWTPPCSFQYRDGIAYQDPPTRPQCEYLEALASHYHRTITEFNTAPEVAYQRKSLEGLCKDADKVYAEFQKAGLEKLNKTDPARATGAPKEKFKTLMGMAAEVKKFLEEKGGTSAGHISYQEAYLALPAYRRVFEDRQKLLERETTAASKDLDKKERASFEKRKTALFESPKPAGSAGRLSGAGKELQKKPGDTGALAKTFGERAGKNTLGGPEGRTAALATHLPGSEASGGVGSASRYSTYQKGADMSGAVPSMKRQPKPYDAVVFYEPDGITHAAAGVILPDGRVVRQDAAFFGVRPAVVYKNLDEARKNMSAEVPNAEVVILPRKQLKDGKYSGQAMLEYMDKPRNEFGNTIYCSSHAATVLNKGGYDVHPNILGSGALPVTLKKHAETMAKELEEEERKG